MGFELIKSDKGKSLIKYQNYLYRKKSQSSTTSYWCCVFDSCYARAKLTIDNAFSVSKDHNHGPDLVNIIERQQRNEIKNMVACNPTISGTEIYHQATQKVIQDNEFEPELIGSALKPFISVQPTISYNKLKRLPPLPMQRSEIVFPDNFMQLENGQNFLMANDGDNDKILLFATEEFFKCLCNAETIYMDGTFQTVPALFYQLYTIHTMVDKVMVPVLYALLPDKQKTTYVRFFRLIQDCANARYLQFSPKTFIIDFEMGVIAAIKSLFVTSDIKCCRFHFSQCIYRKLQKLGLSQDYQNNRNTHKTVKRLMSLSLVKPEHITSLFETIVLEADDDERMDELLEYFFNNFYKTDARFERELWNVFDLDGPSTTNHLEGWHNALRLDVKISHPNLWLFIKKIMKQQSEYETKLLIQSAGTCVVRNRNKRTQQVAKYQNLMDLYKNDQIEPIQFLDRVKYLKCA